MNVLGTQDAATPPSAGNGETLTGRAGAAMGKEDFLKMLVTQLRNQDPMNPLEGHEFAAQLAQFSSVEQLIGISDALSETSRINGMLAQSINSGVAAGLIGKTVFAAGDAVHLPPDGAAELHFKLERAAQNVTATIRDAAGNVVRTFELGANDAGEHGITWDGLDANGARVPPGTYRLDLTAIDSADAPVEAESFVKGAVDRVSFGKHGILLWIGDRSVAMENVESVE